MTYTHTYEIKVNGIDLQGMFDLTPGVKKSIKIEGDVELEIEEMNAFNLFVKRLTDFCNVCGQINKIEINKIVKK